MFSKSKLHICTVNETVTRLPILPSATCWARFKRRLQTYILLHEMNPNTPNYFRSEVEVFEEKKKQMFSNSWVIHPFSSFRSVYSVWLAVIFMLSVIVIPMCAAFPKSIKHPGFYLTNMFLNASCLFEVIMQFFTGYTIPKEKIVVMNLKKIFVHQIFNWHLICDLLSSIPQPEYYLYEDNNYPYVISFLSLLKLTRISSVMNYMTFAADFFRINTFIFKYTKYIILTFLFLHTGTCIFHFHAFAEYHYHKGESVLIERTINEPWVKSYALFSYYVTGFVLATEIGNLNKAQIVDHYIAVLLYIVGKLYILYITVVLLDLYSTQHALEVKYYSIMSQVECYMDTKKIMPHLRQKILAYYTYKYNRKYFKVFNISTFFSEQLKNEINAQIYMKLLREVQILTELPKESLDFILSHLKTEIYLPNDVIIKAGEKGDCMYFLASGTVAVYSPSGGEVCHLKDGDYFGEIALLCDVKRTASVFALEICKIYILNRNVFKKCFSKQADLYKKMRDQAIVMKEVTEEFDLMISTHQGGMDQMSRRSTLTNLFAVVKKDSII